ncbi:hypothetical protein SPB21_27675 [Leptothoe sp. ISB3NOV94-8A]
MAAAITTVSTTNEQQLLETARKSKDAIEAFAAANPEADLSGLSVTERIDLPNGRITYTIVVPVVETNDADGGFSIDANEVMV